MDRRPRKRRQTRLTQPRPDTLREAWQRMRRPSEEPDAWLTDEYVPQEGAATERHGWLPLPPLPKWPPLPEASLPGSGFPPDPAVVPPDATPEQVMVSPTTSPKESPPGWPRPTVEQSPRRTLVQRYRSASQWAQAGIAGALVVASALCVLLGSSLVGSVFPAGAPHTGAGAHAGTGPSAAATTLPTQTATSPSASASPVLTATPSPLTIAITCADAVGGKGTVCVQTRPNAIVSLSVRYCDGTFARGLQGTAHADSHGVYTWTWSVHTTCASATATVTAKATGRSVTQSMTFSITS